MRSFFIYSFKENIAIYEEIDKSLEILKKNGEKKQKYNYDLFWSWWEKKVEYQDEEVSFLIATDNKDFTIPNDIIIAKKNQFSKNFINDVFQTFSIENEVLTFPKIENLEIDYREVEEPKEEEIVLPLNTANPSLANFFRNKTDEMRG